MLSRSSPGFALSMTLLLLSPLGGCSELVALGSECPVGDTVCTMVRVDGGTSGSAPDVSTVPPNRDAGLFAGNDGGAHDAGSMSNTETDGSTATTGISLCEVGNGEFSLTAGGPGDVTTVSLTAFTTIAPWFTCQPIGGGSNPTTAVRAENMVTLGSGETPAGDVVMAPNAIDATDTFISIRHLVTLVDIPLLQRLPEPLMAGHRYALAIDVQTGNTDALLSLQVRGGNVGDSCVGAQGQTTLYETDPITTTGWRTVCLPFTAKVEYTHLVLSVKSDLLQDARLFLDNLRNATEADCPTLF
jgi:hypothetical protein